MLQIGITGSLEKIVTKEDTALVHKSGTLEVFATPAMIALIEETAWSSVAGELEEGMATVGTALNVRHLSATPVGMKVTCQTRVKEVDGRRIVFEVEVFDEVNKIGEGEHERFIIQSDKFQKKTDEKMSRSASIK